MQAPVVASQSFTVVSWEPDASRRESGEKVTESIQALWPSSVAVQAPVIASQSFTSLSWDPEASRRESGEKATELTEEIWPSSVATQASQSESTCGSRDNQLGK